jgi:hypothetical protein
VKLEQLEELAILEEIIACKDPYAGYHAEESTECPCP